MASNKSFPTISWPCHGGNGSKPCGQAALSTAESLAREEASKFRDAGDKRGEAVLLLAAGEINYNKRGGKKRAEAFEDLKKSRALAQEAGDKKEGDRDGGALVVETFDTSLILILLYTQYAFISFHMYVAVYEAYGGLSTHASVLHGSYRTSLHRCRAAWEVEATAIFVQANAAIKQRQNDDSYAQLDDSMSLYKILLKAY